MYSSFFGTDGIRTKFGTSPLTPHELLRLGFVLGYWIKEKKQKYPHLFKIANSEKINKLLNLN